MSLQSNQLIIHLSPDAIGIAQVKNGRMVQCEQISINIADWSSEWADGLMHLDQPMRQLISRFSKHKLPRRATVLYHSSSVMQQIHATDLTASLAGQAGEVKMRESIGFLNPIEFSTLDDSVDKGGKTTTLVYSDREENLRSIFAWLNRCGLSAQSFIPTSVATIEIAAEIAVRAQADTAVFYMGPETSVMAYANESGLQLIRSAEIGYRKLVEGYMQGLESAQSKSVDDTDRDEQDSEMQDSKRFENAFSYLFKYGIPFKEIEVDGINLRSAVLPIMAPVLQRFCIEIKQTFRFGLGSASMPKYLLLCGPGACIEHMGSAISQHIDMHIQTLPEAKDFDVSKVFGLGTVEHVVIDLDKKPAGLLPQIAREAITKSKLNRSLVAGIAIAAMGLAGEYVHTSVKQNEVEKLVQNDASRLQAVKGFKQQIDSVTTMSGLITDVSHLVNETVGGIPDWHHALIEISEITSDSIRLQEIRGDYSSNKPTIEINGYAIAGSGQASGKALNKFIVSLKSIEGVKGVTLGATSRISLGEDQWGRQFTMKIHLSSDPLPHKQIADANEKQWGTP